MRAWFDEHGQMSGTHRNRRLGISLPAVSSEDFDSISSPARFERQVFKRDSYTCRYCGLRVIAKEVLVAFEKAVGTAEFRTVGSNLQQHGIVHGFKLVADHVLPFKRGGRTAMENLITACPGCNYGKYHFTLKQLGLDDPFKRDPASNGWDGLTSLVSGLQRHALPTPVEFLKASQSP